MVHIYSISLYKYDEIVDEKNQYIVDSNNGNSNNNQSPMKEILPSIYVSNVDNFSWFYRSSINQALKCVSSIIIQRINNKNIMRIPITSSLTSNASITETVGYCGKLNINDYNNNNNINNNDTIGVVIIVDVDYPLPIAFKLIRQILSTYINSNAYWTMDNLNALLEKAQNPIKVDKLYAITKEIEEIQEIMQQNINDILQRGEKLDKLIEDSAALSAASKKFLREAKRQNQCCKLY